MNLSRASISAGLRMPCQAVMAVLGLPLVMVFVISVSLRPAKLWGVSAGPNPETPCRFAL